MLSVAMLVLVSRKEPGGPGGVIDGVLSVGCVGAGVIVGGFVSCVDGDRTLEGCGMDGDRTLEGCGMVVSGVPLGGVRFVDCFQEKRLQKTSSDLKKISIGSVFAAPRRGSYCPSRATCKCGSFSRHSSLLLSSGRSSFGLTTRSTPPSTSCSRRAH